MSDGAKQNTDIEIWRGKSRAEFGDPNRFYADSLHIVKSDVEALGINCGGFVIVKPIREWHRLAATAPPVDAMLRPLLERLENYLYNGFEPDDQSKLYHEVVAVRAALGQTSTAQPEPTRDTYVAAAEAVIAEYKRLGEEGYTHYLRGEMGRIIERKLKGAASTAQEISGATSSAKDGDAT
jgi:hypothetical protein